MAAALPVIDSLEDLLDAIRDLDQRSARIAEAVGRLDASGAWGADGHVSMSSWLRDKARMSHGDATRLVRSGRLLHGYRAVHLAAVDGELTSSQVQSLCMAITAPREPYFAEMTAELIEAIAPLDARCTQLALDDWKRKVDALLDTPAPAVPERMLRWWRLDDGTMLGRFVLDPANAALLTRAIDTARTDDGIDDTRTRPQSNGDAFASMVSFFDAHHAGAGTPRHRPHVELTQQLGDTTVSTSDGHRLDADHTDWLTCDCVLHRVLRSKSAVLDYGRATRSVPTTLFRAVAQRDGGCRFPGCERPVAWCDAHHIRHWSRGGGTNLHNLVLLCAHHHRLVHRQHLEVRLDADATVHIVRPGNRPLTSRPHGPPRVRAA